MAGLKVDILEKLGGVFEVMLTGPLDSETQYHFDYFLEEISIPSTKAIILDMGGVNYISSMGISSIFGLRKRAQDNNFMLLMVNLQPKVKKILDTVQALPPEAIFNSTKELIDSLPTLLKNVEKINE